MNEYDDLDDNRPESRRRDPSLEEDSAPGTVGVYERPERTGISPAMTAVAVIVLLLIAAFVAYMLLV